MHEGNCIYPSAENSHGSAHHQIKAWTKLSEGSFYPGIATLNVCQAGILGDKVAGV